MTEERKLPPANNSDTTSTAVPDVLQPKPDEEISNNISASDTLKALEKAVHEGAFPQIPDDESKA